MSDRLEDDDYVIRQYPIFAREVEDSILVERFGPGLVIYYMTIKEFLDHFPMEAPKFDA